MYGVVPYAGLQARTSRGKFITNTVPASVTPIDWTWKYLNKTGGPDKRYKDNPKIPVIATTDIDFHGAGR